MIVPGVKGRNSRFITPQPHERIFRRGTPAPPPTEPFVLPGSAAAVSTSSAVLSLDVPNYSVAEAANQVLVVAVGIESASARSVASVSYGASPLALARAESAQFTLWIASELWVLPDPPPGTANITVTLNATSNFVVAAFVLRNVLEQAAEAVNGTTTNLSTISASVTTLTNGALLVDCISHGTESNNPEPTETGQTEIIQQAGPSTTMVLACSYRLAGAAGATPMSWGGYSALRTSLAAAAFQAAP